MFKVYRDSIHRRWWTVYTYRPNVSATVLVPHQTGFRTKRAALEYVNRVLNNQ